MDKKINDETKPDNALLIQYLLASEKFKDLTAERDKYKDLYNTTKAEMTKYAQEAGRLAAERDRYKADLYEIARDANDLIYDLGACTCLDDYKKIGRNDTACVYCNNAMNIENMRTVIKRVVEYPDCYNEQQNNHYKLLYDIEHRRRVAAEKYLKSIEYIHGNTPLQESLRDEWQSIKKEAGE